MAIRDAELKDRGHRAIFVTSTISGGNVRIEVEGLQLAIVVNEGVFRRFCRDACGFMVTSDGYRVEFGGIITVTSPDGTHTVHVDPKSLFDSGWKPGRPLDGQLAVVELNDESLELADVAFMLCGVLSCHANTSSHECFSESAIRQHLVIPRPPELPKPAPEPDPLERFKPGRFVRQFSARDSGIKGYGVLMPQGNWLIEWDDVINPSSHGTDWRQLALPHFTIKFSDEN